MPNSEQNQDNVLHQCPISEHLLDPPAMRAAMDIPGYSVDCRSCGKYLIDLIALNHLPGLLHGVPGVHPLSVRVQERRQAVLKHAIRKINSTGRSPLLTDSALHQILSGDRLPGLTEQADNLLKWLYAETDPESSYSLDFDEIGGIVGARSVGEFNVLIEGMKERGLLARDTGLVRLSYGGLARIEELEDAAPSGNNAFMAMKFGDPRLDTLVTTHLKPAVEQTGFSLHRLDDRPQAGLIDARLRNEIKNSRFLIVNLSHANAGAYWEAGYAEGLGKPVIYICEQNVFDGKADVPAPHFDTNHHTTIKWNASTPHVAAQKLKETIRYTIPEARQNDNS